MAAKTPKEIDSVLSQAGVTGDARLPLLCISHVLTGGNPSYYLPWVGGGDGADVRGMFQVHEGNWGSVPNDAIGQAKQARDIWPRQKDTMGLPSKRPTDMDDLAEYLAVAIVGWRRPVAVSAAMADLEELGSYRAALTSMGLSEGFRYLEKIEALMSEHPEVFSGAGATGGADWGQWSVWIGLAALGVLLYYVVRQ